MTPLTFEWVEKAEEDFRVARLQEAGLAFPRTHSLPALLQLVLAAEPLWSALSPALHSLNVYGINFRYPGANAAKADARQTFKDCQAVRKVASQPRIAGLNSQSSFAHRNPRIFHSCPTRCTGIFIASTPAATCRLRTTFPSASSVFSAMR